MATKKKAKAFKEIQIKSVSGFIIEINKFKKGRTKVWYRGHAEYNFKLEPSIYRNPFEPKSELELMSQFKSRAIPYLDKIPAGGEDKEYWEWLFLMQHYKIPTRLLDWTESALVALAFAVIYRDDSKKRRKNHEGAHVWCLDALKLNSKYNPIKDVGIPNITVDARARELCAKDKKPEIGDKQFPIAVYGPQNNPRIVGQKGVFTVFPASPKYQYDDYINDYGIKLTIKTEALVKSIVNELFGLGISESMIFPELDSISAEINREYKVNKSSKPTVKKK